MACAHWQQVLKGFDAGNNDKLLPRPATKNMGNSGDTLLLARQHGRDSSLRFKTSKVWDSW